ATLILSITMIVAMQTGTDFPSYPHSKIGSRGWFFAGNDLSSLFAIMFPIIVLYSIHKTTSFSKIYYWIPTILAMYASIMVGTKVGYGAIVITICVNPFPSFLRFIIYSMNEKKSATPNVITIALTPHTPIAKNMGIHMQIYEYKKSVQEEKDRKEG
ncbi:O-antigen ligase family protein, partial [Bacillus sp. SS-TM]